MLSPLRYKWNALRSTHRFENIALLERRAVYCKTIIKESYEYTEKCYEEDICKKDTMQKTQQEGTTAY